MAAEFSQQSLGTFINATYRSDRERVRQGGGGDRPANILAELPVCGLNEFGLSPDTDGPVLSLDLWEAAVAEVAHCDGDEVGRDWDGLREFGGHALAHD